MTQYDIYGIGAALVDTEIQVTDFDLQKMSIDKGVMTLVDEAKQNNMIQHLTDHLTKSKRASGGSAANSIIAASYFGAQTFYSCRVANDSNGQFYLKDLSDAGVSFHPQNGVNDGITGKCLVLITPDAERSMNTFLGISEHLNEDDIDPIALAASQYVYLEGYLVTSETGRPAAIKLKKIAEENNVKTAISLSDPAIVEFFHDGLSAMIGEGVDLLFCNQAEAEKYTKTNNLNEAIHILKNTAKQFAITLGSKGAVLFDGEELINIAPHSVTAVDTNGAGDMFAGAFLYAITQGQSFEEAGKLASKASSIVVSQFGPRLKPEQHKDIQQSV